MARKDEARAPEPAFLSLSRMRTDWGRVRQAQGQGAEARRALGELVERYYPAVRSTLRKRGLRPDDAEEITHRFVTRMLEGRYVRQADASRGLFRKFLKTCLVNFLKDEWDKAAVRRAVESLDDLKARGAEPATADDLVFDLDRQWAKTVWKRSLTRLRNELEAEGNAVAWRAFKRRWLAEGKPPSYTEIGAALGVPATTVNNHLHRTRDRFQAILFEQVRPETSSDAEAWRELGLLEDLLS